MTTNYVFTTAEHDQARDLLKDLTRADLTPTTRAMLTGHLDTILTGAERRGQRIHTPTARPARMSALITYLPSATHLRDTIEIATIAEGATRVTVRADPHEPNNLTITCQQPHGDPITYLTHSDSWELTITPEATP